MNGLGLAGDDTTGIIAHQAGEFDVILRHQAVGTLDGRDQEDEDMLETGAIGAVLPLEQIGDQSGHLSGGRCIESGRGSIGAHRIAAEIVEVVGAEQNPDHLGAVVVHIRGHIEDGRAEAVVGIKIEGLAAALKVAFIGFFAIRTDEIDVKAAGLELIVEHLAVAEAVSGPFSCGDRIAEQHDALFGGADPGKRQGRSILNGLGADQQLFARQGLIFPGLLESRLLCRGQTP